MKLTLSNEFEFTEFAAFGTVMCTSCEIGTHQ